MAKVSIDNKLSEMNLSPALKVSDAIHQVLSAIPTNRMVTKIILDGNPLEQSNSKNILENDFSKVNELEFRTIDREIWAINGLDMALNAAERVQKSLIRVAENFREEKIATGNQLFVQCVDGLERFYDAITISRSVLKLDFNQVQVDGMKLSELEQFFSLILKSIVECQEAKDYDKLSDKIEYELIPNMSSWGKALNSLKNSQNSNA